MLMRPNIILHGGAGRWSRSKYADKAREAVMKCAEKGMNILRDNGSAIDAVVEAVKCMEDSGYLNAGVGSVLDFMGGRSLDAGVMDGATGRIGAVASVTATRNPVVLARIVMEKTDHHLIGGKGADLLAFLNGLPPLPPPPLHVWERYQEAVRKLLEGEPEVYRKITRFLEDYGFIKRIIEETLDVGDTVGAVAVDSQGRLAAAVSTGGVILKFPGRIGDSPIPGAGFYASAYTACSATGIGEKIMECMTCKYLDTMYRETKDLVAAAEKTLEYVNKAVGENTMGFIAIDKNGEIVWAYNTEAMLIGYYEDDNIKALIKPPRTPRLS